MGFFWLDKARTEGEMKKLNVFNDLPLAIYTNFGIDLYLLWYRSGESDGQTNSG